LFFSIFSALQNLYIGDAIIEMLIIFQLSQ